MVMEWGIMSIGMMIMMVSSTSLRKETVLLFMKISERVLLRNSLMGL